MDEIKTAQREYVRKWERNARQHFMDGDYDWVASLVKKIGVNRVLEIGCGTGYSTIAFANKSIQTIAIDSIPEAIDMTINRLKSFGFLWDIFGKENKTEQQNVLLCNLDVIEDYDKASEICQSVDLILVCNPGGKLSENLTCKELEMLHWGRYPDEQMKEESAFALHKWAILLAAARLAKENAKYLVIVDRGTDEECREVLEMIKWIAGLESIGISKRNIAVTPPDGIPLSDPTNRFVWIAGLFRADSE